mgnify:CR=1 FL=1
MNFIDKLLKEHFYQYTKDYTILLLLENKGIEMKHKKTRKYVSVYIYYDVGMAIRYLRKRDDGIWSDGISVTVTFPNITTPHYQRFLYDFFNPTIFTALERLSLPSKKESRSSTEELKRLYYELFKSKAYRRVSIDESFSDIKIYASAYKGGNLTITRSAIHGDIEFFIQTNRFDRNLYGTIAVFIGKCKPSIEIVNWVTRVMRELKYVVTEAMKDV